MGISWYADGQFSQLHDIAVDPNGQFIYTVELDNHRVQKFFPNGTFISKFGYEETGGDAQKTKSTSTLCRLLEKYIPQ